MTLIKTATDDPIEYAVKAYRNRMNRIGAEEEKEHRIVPSTEEEKKTGKKILDVLNQENRMPEN